MAKGVEVHVTDRAVITALNTPGGAIFVWRDKVAVRTVEIAFAASPVNDPLNALHRFGSREFGGMLVGEYKAGWGWDPIGSNGDRVRATIYNTSDHADIVEYGRRASYTREVFSWTGHSPPGAIGVHMLGTSGREGRHILAKSAAAAVGAAVGGVGFQMFTPD